MLKLKMMKGLSGTKMLTAIKLFLPKFKIYIIMGAVLSGLGYGLFATVQKSGAYKVVIAQQEALIDSMKAEVVRYEKLTNEAKALVRNANKDLETLRRKTSNYELRKNSDEECINLDLPIADIIQLRNQD